jgi:hypothetical protein
MPLLRQLVENLVEPIEQYRMVLSTLSQITTDPN